MESFPEQQLTSLQEAVQAAAEAGDEEGMVQALQDLDAEVRAEVLHGWLETERGLKTPLFIAAELGHTSLVTLLAQHWQVSLEQWNESQETALQAAASYGQWEAVVILVESGADIGVADKGNTPLLYACRQQREDMMRFCTDQGASVNVADASGCTPLIEACMSKLPLGVQHLLEQGADPNKSRCGMSPLDFAIQGLHSLQIISDLLQSGASIHTEGGGRTSLVAAALLGKEDVVHLILQDPQVSRQDRVDAFEALGSTLCLTDLDWGYRFLHLAMLERFSDPHHVLVKPQGDRAPAHCSVLESQTVEGLSSRAKKPFELLMEALNIQERFKGLWRVCESYKNVCGILNNMGCSDKIIPLWLYALKKESQAPMQFVDRILAFALDYIREIVHGQEPPKFADMKQIFQFALSAFGQVWRGYPDIKMLWCLRFLAACLYSLRTTEGEEVLVVTRSLLELQGSLDGLTSPLHLVVREFARLPAATPHGFSPFTSLVHLLVVCGASATALDRRRNTPLHLIVKMADEVPSKWVVETVIHILVHAGAHVDCPNSDGQAPMDVCNWTVKAILKRNFPIPLVCLAARV